MRLLALSTSTLATVGVLHLHPHGSGANYVGVFLAALVTWVSVPGPGEAALIAACIAAAHGHLDLASVLAVAWAGAVVGGNAGWLLGRLGGRAALTVAGPLRGLRLRLVQRGDRFYERYGMIAALFTPTWVAGIHHMRSSRFIPVNAVSAAGWALALGLGAYLVGPSIADIAADAGLAGGLLIGAAAVAAMIVARRRRAQRSS